MPILLAQIQDQERLAKHKKAIQPEKAEPVVVRGRVCGHRQLCLKDLWTLGQPTCSRLS